MKSNQTTRHVVNWLELGVSKLQVPSKWLHSKATRKDPSALIKYSVDVPWDLHDTRVAPLVEQRCKLDLSLLAQVFNCTYWSCNLWEILAVISLMHALSTYISISSGLGLWAFQGREIIQDYLVVVLIQRAAATRMFCWAGATYCCKIFALEFLSLTTNHLKRAFCSLRTTRLVLTYLRIRPLEKLFLRNRVSFNKAPSPIHQMNKWLASDCQCLDLRRPIWISDSLDQFWKSIINSL